MNDAYDSTLTGALRNPYPGLRPFRRDESELFFGRDSCVEDMLARLAASRFLAVLGPSGAGKSSLVRTGLIEALFTGGMASAGSRWMIAEMRPAGRPMENLARALARATGKGEPGHDEVMNLTAFLWRSERAIEFWCGDGNLPVGSNLLILADQFEELFSHSGYAARDEAEGFVRRLIKASLTAGIRVYVVLTMRSDYLGSCALLPNLAERINEGLYLTRRVTSEEMREAITGPAFVCGFTIEPRLVDRIVNDLAGFAVEESGGLNPLENLARRADQLPLMQHALNQIYLDAAAESDATGSPHIVLRAETYERLGSLTGALTVHGRKILDQLGPDAAVAQTVFRALVEGDTLASALRRPRRFKTLVELADGRRDAVERVVTAFAAENCNFLQIDPPGRLTDGSTVEIRHESLIRQWQQLSEWTKAEADERAAYALLAHDAEKWRGARPAMKREMEQDTGLAWEKRNDPAPAWARHEGGDAALTRTFLAASRARARRFKRRYQAYGAMALVLAVIAGGLLERLDIPGALIIPTIEAHLGSARAADQVADAYAGKNDKLAFCWYRRAAIENDFHGEVHAGMDYYYGTGTSIDRDASFSYLRAAVDQDGTADSVDSAEALQVLGLIYQFGSGAPSDPGKSFDLFKRAADAGYTFAEYKVGYFFDSGFGTKQDYGQAASWYTKAATAAPPNVYAAYNLATLYENGNGEPQSNTKAISWFEVAAKGGYADGARQAGLVEEQDKNYAAALADFAQVPGLAKAAIGDDQTDSYDAMIAAKSFENAGWVLESGLATRGGQALTGPDALNAAVESYQQGMDWATTALAMAPGDADSLNEKAELLGDRSWSYIRLGRFQDALNDTVQAVNLLTKGPSDGLDNKHGGTGKSPAGVPPLSGSDVPTNMIWLLGNQADAKMLLGDIDGARAIYLNKAYMKVTDTGTGLDWADTINSDFAVLTGGDKVLKITAPIDKLAPATQAKVRALINQVQAAFAPPVAAKGP